MKTLALTVLAFSVLAFLAACNGEGDDSASPSPTATATPTPQPSPTATVSPAPTQAPNVCLANPDPATPEFQTIDEPIPADRVTSPLTVAGDILAFEGTFQVALFDADGVAIVETFGTSQANEIGQLGPFTISIEFNVSTQMPACLWVYEESAMDGSPIHVGQIPLVLLPASAASPTPDTPDWLSELIRQMESEPVANPPAFITRYEYKGQTVYFLAQRCCDIFSNLYDADGNIIAHPDGGITGQGDGRAPDFFEERTNERIVWEDERDLDPGQVQVLAPIESAKVMSTRTMPPIYSVIVESGLPNGCVSFGGYTINRDGSKIGVAVVNWEPTDYSTRACAEVYGTVETVIPLGSQFDSGVTYTVDVNGTTATFEVS